jgi:hypothetical protein
MQDFSQNIITELEARGATPKPRWHFLLMRALFWLLSALSVAVGGIAFSVAWYVFFDNDGLHVTLQNLLQVIPYVWLVVLGLFILGAYAGFRQTRKGYRYATALLLTLILAASIALGLVLDNYDIGQNVHKYLLAHTGFYDGLIYSSEDTPD